MTALIVIGIIAICIISFVAMYNNLIKLRNKRENAFADIDTQLQLRFDLVDNLVSTVKGYAKHEKDTLTQVIAARQGFMNSNTVEGKIDANNQLTSALKTIFALAESYPELKANQNFMSLQSELSDIENKIASARRYFNATTREYNTSLETFPSNMIAGMFGFQKWEFFELDKETASEVKKAPKVEF